MRVNPPISSRRWLWIGVLVANLLVVTMAGVALSYSWGQYRERAFVTVENLSKVLEQNLVATIEKIDTALLSVNEEIDREKAAGGIDQQALDAFLARIDRRLPESLGIRVSSAEGVINYAVSDVMVHSAQSADRDYFIRLRDDPKAGLIMTGPFLGRTSGKWILIPARRLNTSDGAFAGVVLAPIPETYLEKQLSSIDMGPHGVVIMFSDTLKVVARYPEAGQTGSPVGSTAISPQVKALISSGQQAARYKTLSQFDGLKRIHSYRQVGAYPLYLSVGMADVDYFAAWWDEVVQVAGLVILIILASLTACWLIGRRWKDRAEALSGLARQEERFRLLFHNGNDAIFVYETDPLTAVPSHFTEVNDIACQRLAYCREDLLRMMPADIEGGASPPSDAHRRQLIEQKAAVFERIHVTKDGRAIPVEINARMFELQGKTMVLAVARDITERKEAERKIQELAYLDGLTTLPNRRLLMDRLGHALSTSVRNKQKGGLLLVDLDNFKSLNDTLGHAEGDLLLQQAARRLTASVREGDTVARLGGDEFVVMLEDLGENPHEAAARIKFVGEKILTALAAPYSLSVQEHHSSASIGAALFGEQYESLDDLLKRADIAMYQAKAAGRNALCFFDPDLQSAVKARASTEKFLRQAIKDDQFLLYYQPQMDRDRLIGAEALIRWNHPERGMVSPNEFIPLAEETGLILSLGNWVLDRACSQIAAWAERKDICHITVAVNVSARQFRQSDFVDQVLTVLDRTGANPQYLKLELTESMLVDNIEDVIAKMTALKARGLSFSLDDFGTGYSSLSYLKRLPLDQLKIDQSFIRDLMGDLNSGAIAQTIIALGRTMGLSVIAEGVETEEQRAFLARLGCHLYQGYLFSRPVAVAEFEELLEPRFRTQISAKPQ